MNIKLSKEVYVRNDFEGLWTFGNSLFENTVKYDKDEGISHIRLSDKTTGSTARETI